MKVIAPDSVARRHDLDALRAFAMLLGVLFHASLPFVTTGWMVSDWKQVEAFGIFPTWVHGFRMPLFMFVSGYFTRLLWRRKGPMETLKQRFLRVFLPLLIGFLTLVPIQDHVVAWARARAAVDDARRSSLPEYRAEVVEAVRKGDLNELRRLLEAGADPNQVDPEFRNPALAWAAHLDQLGAARLLVEKGADIDRPSPGGHRAIHSAAYFAHPAVLDFLLEKGANVTMANDAGERVSRIVTKRFDEVKGVATYLRLPWSMTEERFAAARESCRTSIQRHGGGPDSEPISEADASGWLARSRLAYRDFLTSDRFLVRGKLPLPRGESTSSWHLFTTGLFDHLWFLWYLCWLVGIYALVIALSARLRIPSLPSRWISSPFGMGWLIPVTMIPQLWMGVFGPAFGPDTSVGLLPQPHILLYYGIFFGAGVLYLDAGDREGRLGRRYGVLLGTASLVLLPVGLATLRSLPLVSGVAQVAFAWCMCFGLIGLLYRHVRHESPSLRYLSDSAYWLYLVHHPLVAVFQSAIRPWDLPAMVKWILLCVVLLFTLLSSYHFLVRRTWLGWLLNGRRHHAPSDRFAIPASPSST